jgi:hypothetical protein
LKTFSTSANNQVIILGLISEEFEDTKGVIRICKSKRDRQHHSQKEEDKRTNNDLHSIHIKLNIVFSLGTKISTWNDFLFD